jgi:hypothetical protein
MIYKIREPRVELKIISRGKHLPIALGSLQQYGILPADTYRPGYMPRSWSVKRSKDDDPTADSP